MRWCSVRMVTYREDPQICQRSAFFAMACLVRVLADSTGDWASFPWLEAASMRWCSSAIAGPRNCMADLDLCAYLGLVAHGQGWQPDPVSREQLHVSEACICVQLQHFARHSSRRASRVSTPSAAPSRVPTDVFGWGPLADTLAASFPKGLPRRLFITGAGGTGKTVLTKQMIVACCHAQLEGQTQGLVPFRIALAELAPVLNSAEEDRSCWSPLRRCLERSFREGSVQSQILDQAVTEAKDILLVLDGFDEAPSHRNAIMAWIARLERVALVVLTD